MKRKILHLCYKFLAKCAHYYINRHNPVVIWVNGSVWKTSCRMIIYQTLQHFFPDKIISTSPKNFNWEFWLSLSVFEITERAPSFWNMIKVCFQVLFISFFGKKKYDAIILEYWIDNPGEMDFILKVAHPDIGVFTAIDAVHSEQFWNPQKIANEEIKMALNTKSLVFLNANDEYAQQLAPRIKVDKLMYQTFDNEKISADIFFDKQSFKKWKENSDLKSYFSLHIRNEEYKITTNLLGKMNYWYIWVSIWIAETLAYRWKVDLHLNPKKQLELNYKLQPGRLSLFEWKFNSIIIDSTYNSSPLSIRKTIDTVYSIQKDCFQKSEIWLILWDMSELWDLTESEHRKLAGYVSQAGNQIFLLWNSMKNYLADELDKIWTTDNLTITKSLQDLNQAIEKKLKEREKSDKNPVILVFKWSQNTIFLEEAVKYFLNNKSDEKLLTRQSDFWIKKKWDFLK